VNQPSRFERLAAIQKVAQIDAFLFTAPSTVRWLSNYFFNFETGPSPFQLLPAALIVQPSLEMHLLIADNEALPAVAPGFEMTIVPYSSYVYEKPLDFTQQFLDTLYGIISRLTIKKTHLGIESGSLPLAVFQFLTRQFPQAKFTDVTREIAFIKAVKDRDEIENIRAACHLCDIGQTALLKHTQAGLTELGLFSLVRLEMESSAGTRIPVMADLVSGTRTATGGGIPTNKVIQTGDLVLCDITPCLNGYWGDSCNTVVVGTANSSQRESFKRINEALHFAIQAVRPGVTAMEIDSLMRKHIGNFPHHGGHGVGTQYHEEPRIVPGNGIELAANMVIALEPGLYNPDFGIRLEHLVLVTETGCEILTKFHHCFELIS
jgi:Xaa-Pro dipeptidase